MSRKVVGRTFGLLLVLVGLFFVVAGALTPAFADIDVDTSGKVVVGCMYALIGVAFLAPGVALLRRRS